MLTPISLFPDPPPVPLFELALAFAVPPGAPRCFPSGLIAMRAARFPSGGATGAGGPGVAESAMKVEEAPFEASEEAISGEGPASTLELRAATRGAAPAFISSFGFAGTFCAVAI